MKGGLVRIFYLSYDYSRIEFFFKDIETCISRKNTREVSLYIGYDNGGFYLTRLVLFSLSCFYFLTFFWNPKFQWTLMWHHLQFNIAPSTFLGHPESSYYQP